MFPMGALWWTASNKSNQLDIIYNKHIFQPNYMWAQIFLLPVSDKNTGYCNLYIRITYSYNQTH